MTQALEAPRRSLVGTVSLAAAVAGAVASHLAFLVGPFAGAVWLRVVSAGFEAAVVGALADWFAVTALFRHPLGIPIPHTAIIPTRREKIIESIVVMVEREWLSPSVIGARLERLEPSALLVDWLETPGHVERLGAPLRDLVRAVVRTLREPETRELVETSIRRQLADAPIDRALGEHLALALESPEGKAGLASVALSLANLADRPRTAAELQWWLDRSAATLREGGRRLVPFFLRRKIVQRKIIEAACAYASAELRAAAEDPEHPLRRSVTGAVRGFADRLSQGDPEALRLVERLRTAVVESLESGPVVSRLLERLAGQIEGDLADPGSRLSELIDRKLHAGIVGLLADRERAASFATWVRATARDLIERHHHEIGRTVRENLERLDTGTLVKQIEDRVGADLQFIRLNGAVVGGLIGLLLALLHLVR